MAKRFTDSNKYRKKFYRNLPGAYKLLWDFLYHDCDNCGIWIVDFEMAQNYLGKDMPVDAKTALDYFNSDETRIIELKGGDKWFLPGFIEFQYAHLSEKNRAHIPVIAALKKFDLLNPDLSIKEKNKGDTGPLQGAKDKAQDKEMDKDKDKEAENSVNPESLVPMMAEKFRDLNPAYPFDQQVDFPSLRLIAEKILKWLGLTGGFVPAKNRELTLYRWGEIVDYIPTNQHLSTYSLTQINKHFQSVVQSFNNAGSNGNSSKNHKRGPVITGTATGAGSL